MKNARSFEELYKKMENFNVQNYHYIICQNIKRIRKELFEEYQAYYKLKGTKNPYTTQSVAELLDISYEYYKRIESFDKTKPISLKVLLKAQYLFDRDIEEFFRDHNGISVYDKDNDMEAVKN